MAIKIFDFNTLISDNEEFFKKTIKHYGVIVLGHRWKKKLPLFYIPTQDLTTEHIFLEQLTKVEYGKIFQDKEDQDGQFIRFRLKYKGQEISLMMTMNEASQKRFIDEMMPWCRGYMRHLPFQELLAQKSLMYKLCDMREKYEDEFEESRNVANVADSWKMMLYANFMSKHSDVKRKDLVKTVKQRLNDNAPQFIKTFCPESNCEFWSSILTGFIIDHRCNLQLQGKCSGYSLKKCSLCLVARYCSKHCQVADFKEHSKNQCQYWKEKFRSEDYIGESLQTILKESLPKKACLSVTYDEFHSMVSSKVLDASLNFVSDQNFINRMVRKVRGNATEVFFETFEKADVSKFEMLVKEKPLPRDVILKQLEDTWGRHSLFNPSEEEENRERKAMLLRAFMSGLLGVDL